MTSRSNGWSLEPSGDIWRRIVSSDSHVETWIDNCHGNVHSSTGCFDLMLGPVCSIIVNVIRVVVEERLFNYQFQYARFLSVELGTIGNLPSTRQRKLEHLKRRI